MDIPALTFTVSVESKIARALVDLINGDTSFFAGYYGGRCRWVPPLIDDDLIELPDCMVQIVPESGRLNRLVGRMAQPTVFARILQWEPPRTTPYAAGESEIIENIQVHMERLVEMGSLDHLGVRNGQGILIDPDSESTDPPAKRYATTGMPTLVRQTPRVIDRSSGDAAAFAVIYPMLMTWDTRQNRMTRSLTIA